MQGFHPAVHDFRKTGDVADVANGEPCIAQRLRGAAGGHQFDATCGERAGEVDQAGLVGYGQQRAADFHGRA
jgi:hypothetical protein